ncbi:carboxypeptidase-like regulatory domain-containing protein [Edaphobacter paludis]|uniref:Carboxypeptidase-like regulatory domain-containing protein n=1 Tax=Edaphobacter paludis TaxID=3035702 RepID=A0AAU7DAZ6_9BACT
MASQSAPAPNQTGEAQGTAQVTGVVLDAQGNPVPAASVTLDAPGILGDRTATPASDGTFSFTAVPAGKFRLIVTAPDHANFASPEFFVRPGETIQAPKIALNIATTSSTTVFASPEQVAQAQIQEQEKQRVFGVFQNFYTSYIWKAEPMTAKQKYKLAFRTMGDPTTFVILAGVAGAEQYNNTYPGYGPGIEGYGKRYGAALADSVSSRIIGSAILPSVLHQDPRYFYQGSGSIPSRTWHAISSTLITRGDNGKSQFNYSRVLGNMAAGAIANTYHPESSRGAGLTFQTVGVTLATTAIGNLAREFILRHLEPSVPNFATGK